MKSKHTFILVTSLSIFILMMMFVFASTLQIPLNSNSNDAEGITYRASVCTTVTRVDGTIEDIGCSHNLLMNTGENQVRDAIGRGGAVAAADYIALCDASIGCEEPLVTDTAIDNEFAASGLTRVQGTYYEVAGDGNWSIEQTFTATADNLKTNLTGLFNRSTAETLFAQNNFSLVTLQTNDQITINWTIQVS